MFKKFTKKIIIKTLIISFILCFFSITNANLGIINQSINIKLDPKFPSANQSTTAIIEVYITDPNKAEISWYIDGILKSEGTGNKDFSFRTKDFGEVTNLTVQINSSDVGLLTKSFEIIPAELDLIWEANTFTPPFYKGKALNSHQSIIKIVAYPNFITNTGKKISSNNLLYTWKKDNKVSIKDSGYGNNSFTFIGPELYRNNLISVEVETLNGDIKSKKNIFLKNYSPEIIFYKEDPLLGVLNNRNLEFFPVFDSSSEEIKIVAYPFFFSFQNENNIQYDWLINNKSIIGSENKLTLRRENGVRGFFTVSLKIQDLKNFLLFTENNFNLNFE